VGLKRSVLTDERLFAWDEWFVGRKNGKVKVEDRRPGDMLEQKVQTVLAQK